MIISDDVSIEHDHFVSRYDSRIRPAAHPSDMKMSEKNIQNDILQYFGNESRESDNSVVCSFSHDDDSFL